MCYITLLSFAGILWHWWWLNADGVLVEQYWQQKTEAPIYLWMAADVSVDKQMCCPLSRCIVICAHSTVFRIMLYLTITQFIVFFTDIVLKVRQPMTNEVGQFKDGGTLISFLYPGQNKDLVDQLLAKKLTAFGKLASSEHHRWIKWG